MRGKAIVSANSNKVHGITPAYAGKSDRNLGGIVLNMDHPRVCGEKFLFWCKICICLGSPPRMRGKVDEKLADLLEDRITPAYAGKREVHA